MNEILKKFEKNIDEAKKKNNYKIDISSLISYVIEKINQNTTIESSTSDLESILKKLLENDFTATVKIFCYYIIANFNQEFSPEFFTSISKPLTNDAIALDKFDININALRNFMILNQKELIENISTIENLFKSPKYDLNFIVNAFYFSNYPMLLLNIINKVSADDLRQYKDFLARFYYEFGKLLFFNKLQDGSFLNLIKMLSRILSNFKCLPNISTKEKICNTVLIPLAEYLIINLEELINLMISFDNKLLVQAINLPIELYKIYNYYKDNNNQNKKYEKIFNKYISFLFKEIRNIVDPDIFSEVNKALCEFKIIESLTNPESYSTEIIEIISKFINFSEHLDKTMWFDNNIKNLSLLVNYIENTEVMDLIILLLSETKYIKNHNDRIITLYNLFNRLISLSLDYGNLVEKESLILCLFKNKWFSNLVKISKLEDREENKWRNDIFICLIESLFNSKKILLKNSRINEYINLMQISQDIIELSYNIIDWEGEGQAIKLFFILLEEICIFFNDNFFNYLYKENQKYIEIKERSEKILEEICKRFKGNKKWDEISFSKEESKYYSLLIVSKYLNKDKITEVKSVLSIIFRRLKEINIDLKTGNYIEKLLKCILFLGMRLPIAIKEKIIIAISQFKDNLKIKKEADDNQLICNILVLSEKMEKFLYNNKNSPSVIINNKINEQINNEFFLVVNNDIDNNIETKKYEFNSLFLMNINSNSFNVMEDNSSENSSVYLEYFKNYYYYPLLEFNNDYCYMLIDSKKKYVSDDWKLISGISDPIHIYYRYKTNIETKESEIYIKCFNSINLILNNVSFTVYLSENLLPINKRTIGDLLNLNTYYNGKEYKTDILSPYSYYDFYFKFYSKEFDVNYITVEAKFNMNVDNKNQFVIKCEPFYIPLTTYLIQDNYAIYEVTKFDMFYNLLEYAFSVKCIVNSSPESIIKSINNKLTLIEYNSDTKIYRKEKEVINKIIKNKYHEYYQNFIVQEESAKKKQNDMNLNNKINFKIKLSSYCVYNFWVYLFIIGEYDMENNQSLLNINIKTNDLKGLKVIAKEKNSFIKELFNNISIIY